jgi:hypothetical protein
VKKSYKNKKKFGKFPNIDIFGNMFPNNAIFGNIYRKLEGFQIIKIWKPNIWKLSK